MKRPYIAGPMRDLPNFNFQAFEDATVALQHFCGLDPVSPHQFDMDTGRVSALLTWGEPFDDRLPFPRRVFISVDLSPTFNFTETIDADLDLIERECDGIVLLPGWASSEGANIELAHAERLGLPVHYWNPHAKLLTRLEH